eukprot:7502740-Pyramimonas_sp.AAC.1
MCRTGDLSLQLLHIGNEVLARGLQLQTGALLFSQTRKPFAECSQHIDPKGAAQLEAPSDCGAITNYEMCLSTVEA